MGTGMAIFLIILFVLCAAVILIFRLLSPPQYDERQKLEQGKAYAAGYCTMGVVSVGLAIAQTCLRAQWFDPLMLVTVSLLASLGVFSVTCILRDAYTPLKQQPTATMIAGVLMLISLLMRLWSQRHQPIWDGAKLTTTFLTLLCILVWAAILAAYIGKLLVERKQENGDG